MKLIKLKDRPGYLYIARSEAMDPYTYKLGFTRNPDIEIRMRQLSSAGIIHPFICLYKSPVGDCVSAESYLFSLLEESRVRDKFEVFESVDIQDFIRAIDYSCNMINQNLSHKNYLIYLPDFIDD